MPTAIRARSWFLLFSITSLIATAVASAQTPTPSPSPVSERIWIAPGAWFVYAVIAVILLGSVIALLFVRLALDDTNWSLADALSEATEVTAVETANGVTKPVLDAGGKPLQITELRASSSRVIALLGMIIILMMYLGFGTFALYGFALTGGMPESIGAAIKFLTTGMTLFAPYLINKFAGVFDALSGRK
jgi:hypothetical protein